MFVTRRSERCSRSLNGGRGTSMLGAMAKAAPKPSAVIDTRVIYCGDNLEQLRKLPAACVDLIYIDPPFNSNRNYEVFWGETKEKRAFADRHASTQAYIEFMRPRCVELHRVLKKTGSFYYTSGKLWTWNKMFMPYSEDYLEQNYRYKDADERRFRVSDMTANKPGG